MTNPVWCEIDSASRQPIRIYKNQKEAVRLGTNLAEWERANAVLCIRHAVFRRDGMQCTHCGNGVTFGTGHMHERQARGTIKQVSSFEYESGPISIQNSTTLCPACHGNDPVAGHG